MACEFHIVVKAKSMLNPVYFTLLTYFTKHLFYPFCYMHPRCGLYYLRRQKPGILRSRKSVVDWESRFWVDDWRLMKQLWKPWHWTITWSDGIGKVNGGSGACPDLCSEQGCYYHLQMQRALKSTLTPSEAVTVYQADTRGGQSDIVLTEFLEQAVLVSKTRIVCNGIGIFPQRSAIII